MALSIQPKIPKTPDGGADGTEFSGISFRNFRCTSRGWPKIPENNSCSSLVSRSLEIEFNIADPQASIKDVRAKIF